MTRKRKPINFLRVLILLVLIAVAVYFNNAVIPTIPAPFVATPTATRAPESYLTEAQGLFNEGKLLQAIAVYKEAISAQTTNAATYVDLARVEIYAGQYDEALTHSEDALLLSSNNSMAYAMRGWAYTKKGNYVDAETAIKKAISIDTNNGMAHAIYAELLGLMYQNNTGPFDSIDLASEESRVSVSLAPNSMEANFARGFILEITDNRELAVQAYLAAININPNISEFHLALGRTYKGLGAIANAIDEYTLANTLNPSDPLPNLYTSRAYAASGDFAKAVQSAELAVNTTPTDAYMIGNLGLMLYRNFQWPDSVIQFGLAINGGTTADGKVIEPLILDGTDLYVTIYYYTYALVLAHTNHCSEVVDVARTILEKVPSDADATFNAQAALDICTTNLLTPSPTTGASVTPQVTPTP